MSRLWPAAAVAAGLVWAGVATWLLPVAAGLTALAAWLRGRR